MRSTCGDTTVDWTVLNAAIVLTFSIIVLVGIAYTARRWIGGKASGQGTGFRILARQSLGSKASLVIVEVGDKRYLLGVTEHSVTMLGTISLPSQNTTPMPPPAPKSQQPITPPAELSFRAYLSSLFQRSEK